MLWLLAGKVASDSTECQARQPLKTRMAGKQEVNQQDASTGKEKAMSLALQNVWATLALMLFQNVAEQLCIVT